MDTLNRKKEQAVETSRIIPSLVLVAFGWLVGFFISEVFFQQPENSRKTSLIGSAAGREIFIGSQVLFEIDTDPALQRRWSDNLGLVPIPADTLVIVPDFSMIDAWQQKKVFQRAPYSQSEVQEWQNRHTVTVEHGFVRQLSSGKVVLDLSRDRLTAWGSTEELITVLP
jgi:hypothetical protein